MMEQEQKQIEEMVSIMAASNNPFVDVPVEIMPKVAKALYNAGYGNVEKYRTEIERLKKENHNWRITAKDAQTAIKEFVEKLKETIFDYLGVKTIEEANKLSLIASTLTFDVVTDRIDDLLKEYEQ